MAGSGQRLRFHHGHQSDSARSAAPCRLTGVPLPVSPETVTEGCSKREMKAAHIQCVILLSSGRPNWHNINGSADRLSPRSFKSRRGFIMNADQGYVVVPFFTA